MCLLYLAVLRQNSSTSKIIISNHLLGCNEHPVCLFIFLALQPTVVVFSQPGSGLWAPRVRGFLITHDAPQSVGLLWTSNQFVTEAST
jgi:hypothetical protein